MKEKKKLILLAIKYLLFLNTIIRKVLVELLDKKDYSIVILRFEKTQFY
jgi:hypothetical protein